jgi:hypothetical protein
MKRVVLFLVLVTASCAFAEVTVGPWGGFTSTQSTTLPGAPEAIYDAMTGDILPWWDHHFSETPKSLRLEPWPGGKFIEEFDDKGNGALHATVIYAERPKMIRFDGPLGLSGRAMNFVVTYEFTPNGDSTDVKVTAQMSGQIDEEWANIVDNVWHHFLIEAFKPYIESGKHKK